MLLERRALLGGTAASLAFAGLARAQDPQADPAAQIQKDPYRSEIQGYGPLETDPRGLFDLPRGFSYTVVSEAGRPMDDGLLTPHRLDGMGCFPLDADRVVLVRNNELRVADLDFGAFGKGGVLQGKVSADRIYDRNAAGAPHVGGTSTVVYNIRTRRTESQHLSLAGTLVNCAGGVTPRGTWLSCEETLQPIGQDAQKTHGWVFEVPSQLRELVDPQPIRDMGRFRHEATATDPRTGIVYLTEDMSDGYGLFYRYLPNDRNRLLAGGRLQALGLRGDRDGDPRNWETRMWKPGDWRSAVWIDLQGVDNPHEDLRLRGRGAGAAWFARGEGIHFDRNELFFTCTSGGPAKLGQIMRYRPSPAEGRPGEKDQPGRLQLFVEPTDPTVMRMCDNIAVAPWGHLFVCEDKVGGVNYLKAITPGGKIYTVGRNPKPSQADVGTTSELAGVCFSPDGSTMFVNIYFPGATLAVTGPWSAFRA